MIDIDLHTYKDKLKLKKERGKVYVFDSIRKKYLVLQPEELIRQLAVQFLIEKGYPKEKIQVEKGLMVNGLARRFDIIVYDANFEPFLLVECKAHTVPIDQKTFDQMAVYNLAVRAPYLMACNGVQTYCCKLNFTEKSFEHLSHIPDYSLS